MDCILPVHEILQARILEWVAIPSPGDLSNPEIESGSPTLWADSLLSEPPGKPLPHNIGILRIKKKINVKWLSTVPGPVLIFKNKCKLVC